MGRKEFNYTQNREISWLRFNERVLEEAKDFSVPLLERMKFVAIFTSNLDEFFMIRVGSLYDMTLMKKDRIDKRSGMTAKEQLDTIFDAVSPLYKERDKVYGEIKKQLSPYGVCGLDFKELVPQEKKYVKKYFKEQILPILSPQIVDANHPFPHLLNKALYVVANLSRGSKWKLGIVPVPEFVSDILYLPGHDIRYIRMEKVILEYLELIFDKYQISDKNYICVTRNADITPDDDAVDEEKDLRKLMKKTLHKRTKMAVVRLETAQPLSQEMEQFFCEKFRIQKKQIYRTKMPMKLDYIFGIIDKIPLSMKRALTERPFEPQPSRMLNEGSVMKQVRKKDILLFYPYESMEPFLRLVKEASTDPNVMTIKITIYRLAKKTRLVEYLCAAAENGKEVTVLIELRARFDEQNNIDWSETLEAAGCRVLYGFEKYKVHSKICLITYRNKGNIEYITQIGTGNYNEKTAAMYTDLSLMTTDRRIGEDAAAFFQNMSIGNLEGEYHDLLVSPVSLKKKILSLMDEEIQKGEEGRIVMKMNSVTDIDFMEKLKEASMAGVKISMNVRGICCILPGIAGETDNLSIMSIVGRYLEHARIFCFGKGEEQKIYIGSADMMTRNTEKRVEVACPVYDETIKKMINRMMKIMLTDNVKGRKMQSDGTYKKRVQSGRPVNAQEIFMEEAIGATSQIEKKKKKRTGIFSRVYMRLFGR